MKTKLLFLAGAFFLSAQAYSQVGIKTPTPSSTLDVRGSVEGNYREISGTETLMGNDYHISFTGTSNSILNLPSKSATDGSAADFRGRKYYIKNNSINNILTLTAASGQIIRSGGVNVDSNTIVLQPGKLAVLTAGGANGWDLQEIKWGLFDLATNEPGTSAQTIPAVDTYYTLTDSPVTVTVPTSGAKVLLKFTGYGNVTGSANSYGTVRLKLLQTGTASATYALAAAQSWYNKKNGATTAFDFKTEYSVTNLAPGSYTFSLQFERESEVGTVSSLKVMRSAGRADVYIK
ncbi:hypothetical protein JET18_07135 [Chryseobacterium sp. L7]|uniref:Uncharacterized protein n=1 Tax=Chryseobacterium endalhagicum TaxID=2797638 RepID=A0ABS1QDF6_9FLAO|nr:hypothetical protein [Chryseobacterium endalhagicum]MBL1220606.1 hypothetical protein [Chryseobacterium endalhagicum]